MTCSTESFQKPCVRSWLASSGGWRGFACHVETEPVFYLSFPLQMYILAGLKQVIVRFLRHCRIHCTLGPFLVTLNSSMDALVAGCLRAGFVLGVKQTGWEKVSRDESISKFGKMCYINRTHKAGLIISICPSVCLRDREFHNCLCMHDVQAFPCILTHTHSNWTLPLVVTVWGCDI